MKTAELHSMRWLQAVLLAAIAFPIGIFCIAAWQSFEDAHRVAEDQINRSLDVLNEHALKVFEAVERGIAEVNEIIRSMPDAEIAANEEALHSRLERMVVTSPEMKSIWIFDAHGRALVNSLGFPGPAIDFSDRDYFRAHVEKDIGIFIGQVLQPRAPYGGAPFFGVSARRLSKDGQFTGVIQVSILPDYFANFYQKIGRAAGSYHSLIRDDGLILARSPPLAYDMKLPAQGDLMKAFQAKPSAGNMTVTSLVDGVRRRVAFMRLPRLPVYVLAGRETDAIRNEWLWHEARQLLFGIPATASLILVVLVALRRTRRFYQEADRRRVAEDALKQGQRLEALGHLTGGVAHDFNNLLMVVGGAARKLERLNTNAQAIPTIQLIASAVRKGEGLTKKLLAFSRRQSLSPKTIDLCERVRDLRDVLEQSVRADVRLEIIVPETPVIVHIDPDELEIALLNLTVNARDAMPDGGCVTIEVSKSAGQAVITVVDTGCGIPEPIRERIFEPFFTTKSIDKGNGLGLSQVYGFVQQSKGSIEVRSIVGKGTTLLITLPLSAELLPPLSAPSRESVRSRFSTVLLVEDNLAVAVVASDYLQEFGCTIVHANSAEAAIEILNARRDIDLVLSDVVMPGMSGLELGRWIRQHRALLPVILTSGYSDKIDMAKEEGFLLIRKPYAADDLTQIIGRSLAEQPRPQKRAV